MQAEMYVHVLGNSVNEIHLCPGTRTAEASVAPFHLHHRQNSLRKDFGILTPFSGIIKKLLCLMELEAGSRQELVVPLPACQMG